MLKKKLNEIEMVEIRTFFCLIHRKKMFKKNHATIFFYYKKGGGGHEEHTENQLKTIKLKLLK